MTERVTISLSDDLDALVEEQLDYNDSKSAWVREAIEMRLEAEGVDTGNWIAPTAD